MLDVAALAVQPRRCSPPPVPPIGAQRHAYAANRCWKLAGGRYLEDGRYFGFYLIPYLVIEWCAPMAPGSEPMYEGWGREVAHWRKKPSRAMLEHLERQEKEERRR